MISKKEYDIIIIGAGLSGLTLAVELVKRTNKDVLILEKKKNFNTIKIGVFGIILKINFLKVLIIHGVR